VFGKSASAIIAHLLEHPDDTDFDFMSLVDGRCKASAENIAAAVDGKLTIIRSHMQGLELCAANLQSQILTLAEKYAHQIELVCSVPGILTLSAIRIIAEIGVDMSVFPTAKHLSSWAGFCPRNDQKRQQAQIYTYLSCRCLHFLILIKKDALAHA